MATIVAISVPAALGAQGTPMKTMTKKPTTSCGPLSLIMVTVVDRKGAPVTDAKIDVKRQRDGKEVPGTMTDMSPSGEYVVMDDMALPLVPVAGANFVVRAKRGSESGSVVLRIARSPDGCHVIRTGSPAKLVLDK